MESVKIRALRDVTSYDMVDRYQHFRETIEMPFSVES